MYTISPIGANPKDRSSQTSNTLTVGNSASLFSTLFDIANSTLQPIRMIDGIVYYLSFQPLPPSITSKGAGNNSLGLDPSAGPLTNVLLGVQWLNPIDDANVDAAVRDFIRRSRDAARARGLLNKFLYLNYANKWQDPISSYGAASKARLQAASRKHDPDGIFQKAVPGGFKLF